MSNTETQSTRIILCDFGQTIHSTLLFTNLQQGMKEHVKYLKKRQNFLKHIESRQVDNMSAAKCPPEFQSDRLVVMACLQYSCHYEDAQYMSTTLKNCEQMANYCLDKFGARVFQFFGSEMKDRRDVVLKMFHMEGNPSYQSLLEHVSERLRDDWGVVHEAITLRVQSFQHASLRLRNERDLIMMAAKKNADCLKYVSSHNEVFDSVEFFRELLLHCDRNWSGIEKCIQLATLRVQRDIFPLLLKWRSNALTMVHTSLSHDVEFILSHLPLNSFLIHYLPTHLLLDGDSTSIMERAIHANPKVYQFLPLSARSDLKMLIIAAAFRKGDLVRFAPLGMRNDLEVARKIVAINPVTLKWFSETVRENEEIVQMACLQRPKCFRYCGAGLRHNEEFVRKILGRDTF